jgi:hypothetical protein
LGKSGKSCSSPPSSPSPQDWARAARADHHHHHLKIGQERQELIIITITSRLGKSGKS